MAPSIELLTHIWAVSLIVINSSVMWQFGTSVWRGIG